MSRQLGSGVTFLQYLNIMYIKNDFCTWHLVSVEELSRVKSPATNRGDRKLGYISKRRYVYIGWHFFLSFFPIAIASNLIAMASNLLAMASNRLAMASNLLAMASNRLAMASNLLATASNLIALALCIYTYI